MDDPYNLQRFLEAQAPVYEQVLSELRNGRKQSHWMWFIFPQMKGLGYTAMADKYGIASLEEAEAYLRSPTLGARLLECTQLVNAVKQRSIDDILGYPDNLKFRSSMTLFSLAAPDNGVFQNALRRYFDGAADQRTIEELRKTGSVPIAPPKVNGFVG